MTAFQVVRDLLKRTRCEHGKYPARCQECRAKFQTKPGFTYRKSDMMPMMLLGNTSGTAPAPASLVFTLPEDTVAVSPEHLAGMIGLQVTLGRPAALGGRVWRVTDARLEARSYVLTLVPFEPVALPPRTVPLSRLAPRPVLPFASSRRPSRTEFWC